MGPGFHFRLLGCGSFGAFFLLGTVEKESLLKETHHRVKNNLQIINSLLRLEAARSPDNAVKVALGEMQGRVLSMAVLHETLYRTRTFGRLDLAKYLEKLARQFFRAHADSAASAELSLDLSPVEIPIEQGVPCGLILNELMCNSFKYAFTSNRPGEMRILLRREADDGILLRVTDTGPGLPEDFEVPEDALSGHATRGRPGASDRRQP